MSAVARPSLVLYGTGQFGGYITRFALDKGWPIVAAYNRAGPKVGQDLGRLAGLDRDIGVVVQDADRASFKDLKADIGIVTLTDRLSENMPAYRRLLSAGLNVLCHGAEAYYPFGIDQKLASEIDSLAKANNVTFSGGGIWDLSRIWSGIMVAGPCTQLTSMFHRSVTDAQRMGKQLMLVTGVGMQVPAYIEKMVQAAGKIGGLYKTIPQHVLVALGYRVKSITERREPVVFPEPIYCRLLEQELAPGVCVGTRIVVDAETEEGVTATAQIELRLLKEGESEHMMWSVDGKPSSKVTVERDDSAHATASSLFNRIPDVIAAKPGIVPLYQLGPLRHTALRS